MAGTVGSGGCLPALEAEQSDQWPRDRKREAGLPGSYAQPSQPWEHSVARSAGADPKAVGAPSPSPMGPPVHSSLREPEMAQRLQLMSRTWSVTSKLFQP